MFRSAKPRTRRPLLRVGVPALAVLVALGGLANLPRLPTVLPLRAHGVSVDAAGDPVPVLVQYQRVVEDDGTVRIFPVGTDDRFLPGTSVLASADLADPAIRRQIEEQRAWLAAGADPGSGTPYADMSSRALLDLRALTDGSGAVMASPVTAWRHVWPRDASFVVAAYAVTGHPEDAERVLGFLAQVAPDDGRWEARYLSDGSGRAPDQRHRQFDGAGWVPWAVWTFAQATDDPEQVSDVLEMMRPSVIASANALAESAGEDGLPAPSSDYWERKETELTLGVIAPVSLGLHASIALAPQLGVDPAPWIAAAQRVDAAIQREFGDQGYPRYVSDGGHDAAVSFLAPPFAQPSEQIAAAVGDTEAALRVPNGGHRPGEDWRKDVDVAWTPETAMLALAFAGLGHDDDAERLLTYLDEHRTALGALPEKVDSTPKPASVAPLAWTSALVLLTLTQLDEGLPAVPPLP